jgi:hypothetical protein
LIVNHNFTKDEAVKDDQIASLFLPPVRTGATRRFGKAFEEFGPMVTQASAIEIEKMEKDLERETRY